MNRHDVFIWDPQYRGLPKTYIEALEMAEKYVSLADEPSDRLKRFSQEIANYAQTHQDDLEEEVFDFLDGLQFLVNQQTTAALCTDLPEDDWEQALYLTVERATAKGLIVVVPEIIMAFLPHGHILPPEQAHQWQQLTEAIKEESDEIEKEAVINTQPAEKNLPKTLKQYHKWADVIFQKELGAFGFRQIPRPDWISDSIDSVFVRDVVIGQQYIKLAYTGRSPCFLAHISFGIVSTLGEDIYHKFGFSIGKNNNLFNVQLNEIYDYRDYQVGKVSTIEIKRDVQLIKDNIINLLDVAVDLKGLDAVVNGDISEIFKEKVHKAYVPHRLIIARLANNPQFEQLAIELKLFARDAGRNNLPMREQWDNLVKYLRDEVKPLV